MNTRFLAALVVSLVGATSCDSFKEALTAHVDVVARMNDRELSVNRLSDLLGNSTLQIPVNRETAGLVADLWTGYQLLAVAAARGDSIINPKYIDEATQAIAASMRLRRYMEAVNKTLTIEGPSEATYTQAVGGLFAARHILLSFPGNATPAQRDSVKKKAAGVRARLTAANFAETAKKSSGDAGSAARGGDLGTFPRDKMVKPFSDAVAALRPGDISGLVETEFGYHIIQRSTYEAAKADYETTFRETVGQQAESLYVARVDEAAKVTLKSSAAADAKNAARDLAAHRRDSDVLATFQNGSLTLGRFVRWVELMPPQSRVAQQLVASPDSVVRKFIKSVTRNEVLLKKADSAGVVLTADEQQSLHGEFKNAIVALWGQLGLEPRSLADSGKSVPERERIAAARVESLLDRVMLGQAQAIQVPLPAQSVLAMMYSTKVTPAGIERAVERATRLRASADSLRQAQQPQSQVPLPTRPEAAATPPPAGTQPTKRP
jgi:peptidyl-prolyl cis-trans isomerase D